MGRRLSSTLVCDTLQMALWRRRPPKGQLIHHSDRGVQYASRVFRNLLQDHGIEGSMNRKGDCWDNAVVESFFGSLKSERVHWRSYQTRGEARADIVEYITRCSTTTGHCIRSWATTVQMSSRETADSPMRRHGVSIFA